MLQNLEAEQTLVGLAIVDQECAERLAQLPEDTFYYAETRTLYSIIRQIIKDHGLANLVSISEKIPERALSVIDCSKKCFEMAISPIMYSQIERDLLDLRKRRKLKEVCSKVINEIGNPGVDVDQLTGDLTTVANDDGGKSEAVDMPSVVVEFIEGLDKGNEMISTGIAGLDRITGGLQNGMLAILGARPKVGKSALGLSIAVHVARVSGPVLVVSLEMTPKEIVTRMLAADTEINMHKIVTKNLNDEDHQKLAGSYGYLGSLPIRFIKKQTPLQIRREAASMKRKGGLSMIVVDYIQLMRPDEKTNSRYEAVSSITRELKLMAMDLDVPILALTQFNRDSEQGGVRRKPSMSEARDSGSIEQDANLFLIQYPPTEPKFGSPMYEYWEACQAYGSEFQILEIAANRQGPTGNVLLRFDKKHMSFTTLVKENEQ